MKINNNAIEVLSEVMQQRNWHQGKIEPRLAGMYKTKLSRGGLSYKTACEILELLGWQKIKEETWTKQTSPARLHP